MSKFIRPLTKQISSRLWLHLEDYYNNGITPEEASSAINKMMPDSYEIGSFYCEPMGINGNLIVNLPFNADADMCLYRIQSLLDNILANKNPEFKRPIRYDLDDEYPSY